MPSGIQIWDDNGLLIVDQTTPLVKFLGTLSVGAAYTGSANSGSVEVPEWGQYSNTPFFARSDGGFESEQFDATLSIAGTTLSWVFPQPLVVRPNSVFVYGML